MNDIFHIIILIGLTIFIIFFGGHNFQNKIEYDINSIFFKNLNFIIHYEKQLQNINFEFDNSNFININKKIKIDDIFIPNFVNCFFIKINSYSLFNINDIINFNEMKTHLMIIFNHNKYNNLELLIDNINFDLYQNKQIKPISDNSNSGYFYDLEKIISITGIYHIYNNSNITINITCFIIKKPFWYN